MGILKQKFVAKSREASTSAADLQSMRAKNDYLRGEKVSLKTEKDRLVQSLTNTRQNAKLKMHGKKYYKLNGLQKCHCSYI